MRIPPRILVPVSAAVLLVAVVIVVLFWQLEGTRAMLADQLSKAIGTGSTFINTIIDIAPDTGEESLLHLRKGDVFALRGEWKNAQAEYEEAVSNGGGITALRKLAQAQLQRRDVKAAQNTLDRLRREGARAEDLLLLETVIMLRTGELTKAKGLLDAAQESPHKHYGLALLAIISNDHETAKTELAAVTAGWEPVLRSYARLLSSAYEEYALFPESPALHLNTLLSRSLAQVQECELALPMLAQITAQQDDYRDAWIVQGYCELTSERYPEALASLERAYQLDPEKAEIQYFLARAYLAQNDHANALTYLQYAQRNGFTPQSEVRRLLAAEALELGNVSLALDQFQAMTQEADADLDTYKAYVTAALTAKRGEEAYAKAQEAVAKWPDNAEAHELLGWAAAETNREDEARAELQKALEMEPTLKSAQEKLNDL